MSRALSLIVMDLNRLGIEISVDRGDLVLRGPKNKIPAETLAELRINKAEIVDSLSGVTCGTAADRDRHTDADLTTMAIRGDASSPPLPTQPTKPAVHDSRSMSAMGAMPIDPRERAVWLRDLAGLAGYDVAGFFDLIDQMVGERPLGPYALTTKEAATIAAFLRAEIGTRPAIATECATPSNAHGDALPLSITRKRELRWSDAQFSRCCQQHLGYVGLRSGDDDRLILAAMPRARS